MLRNDTENDDSRYKVGEDDHPTFGTKSTTIVHVGVDCDLD